MKKLSITLGMAVLFTLTATAQKITSNGPVTEIENARISVFSEDDNTLYFCALKHDMYGDDDLIITVYDKVKNSVVREHYIDEDFSFKTAFLQDDNVVLLGYCYNKKTKSLDYFQSSFPVMEKTPRKFVKTVVHSVPAENSALIYSRIEWSPDRTKMAFVTLTRPKKSKTKTYSIDVKVCSIDGNDLMKVQRQLNSTPPHVTAIYLTNDATVYLGEHRKADEATDDGLGMEYNIEKHKFRYLTISSNGEFAPATRTDIDMQSAFSALTPDGNLFMFNQTPTGVSTLGLDQEGKLFWQHDFETEFPKVPEGITYKDREDELHFVPIEVMPLSDGRTIVAGTQYNSHMVTGEHPYTYYVLQSLIIFVFDNNGDMSTQVIPFASVTGSLSLHYKIALIEWDESIWLLYDGDRANYPPHKTNQWKTPRKSEDWCSLMMQADEDLQFESSIYMLPRSVNWGNIIHISDDAIYFLENRDRDNRIERIIK